MPGGRVEAVVLDYSCRAGGRVEAVDRFDCRALRPPFGRAVGDVQRKPHVRAREVRCERVFRRV
jgi:hypothetical protein